MENVEFRIMGWRPDQEPTRGAILWEEGEFHLNVGVSLPGLNPTGLIYKRRVPPSRFGEPTRKLDPNAKANRATLAKVAEIVRAEGLVAKAAEIEAEKARADKAREDRRRAWGQKEDAGPALYAALSRVVERFGALRSLADLPQAQREAILEAQAALSYAEGEGVRYYAARVIGEEHWNRFTVAATPEEAAERYAWKSSGRNALPETVEVLDVTEEVSR